ncbi:alpha/beta hydrolase [Halobacillus mangrovi]|uniref:alpha/beta hydrolase n=1 Tax=Halobacillus mangrovi TaxID=402384 RepID=UPI003D98A51A
MTSRFYKKNKKFLSIIMTSILIGLTIFFIQSTPTRSENSSELVPTIFVHGYKGGPMSFGNMIDRFQDSNWGSKRMVVYVRSNGELSVRGGIPHNMNPMIQVLFEDDRASLQSQTLWMQKVMSTLYEKHDIEKANLVGHSMGGLASASFLMNNQQEGFPTIQKLAVIASPFEGIEKQEYFKNNNGPATDDLRPGSDALEYLFQHKEDFDQNVQVLAIAGVINPNDLEKNYWDGLVHTSSVQSLSEIVPFGSYQEHLVYGKAATHSGLHEHPEVDHMLGEFLWNIKSQP